MSAQTTRLELVKPTTTDVVPELRTAIATNADNLDHAVVYDEGPLSSRPAATVGSPSEEVGNHYLVTNGPVPMLWRNAGTRWVPMTMPTFSARPSTDTNALAASSTPTKVLFDSEEWDDGGFYTPATSRFLPLVAGVYRLRARIGLRDNLDPGDVLSLVIRKNGVEAQALDYRAQGGVATGLASVGGSVLVTANGASDYFEVWAACSNGASRRYFGGVSSSFQGELVRPA